MHDIPPALDRQAVVIDLANRLGSLDYFMDGINDVMKFSHLEDRELQRYSRKIIALTEGARMTLKREGVGLYLFVICPEEFLPYKSAYFKLLVWIRRRRPAFPADMDARIASLLSSLKTNFVIRCGGVDPRAQLGIEELLVPRNPLVAWKGTNQTAAPATDASSARKSYSASDVMLPPDTFERKRQRIDRLKVYVKSEAANMCYAPNPQQYLASANWAPPQPRRPFVRTVRTESRRLGVSTGKQSSLDDLFKPVDLD
ncbi:hypothetical protein EDB19DRAFT_309372 [Suillus lakei]|nr:hypothetical protein EDB19DRAFT_309372 [Suillus lakei]